VLKETNRVCVFDFLSLLCPWCSAQLESLLFDKHCWFFPHLLQPKFRMVSLVKPRLLSVTESVCKLAISPFIILGECRFFNSSWLGAASVLRMEGSASTCGRKLRIWWERIANSRRGWSYSLGVGRGVSNSLLLLRNVKQGLERWWIPFWAIDLPVLRVVGQMFMLLFCH
jgi:hypothetical protein